MGSPVLKRIIYTIIKHKVLWQLCFVDFVVYTVTAVHVERIYFDKAEWEKCTLPELTSFFFNYLLPDTVTVLLIRRQSFYLFTTYSVFRLFS